VIDQGPGIPPEDREHIFESFWRGARSTYKGTGLGLSIVKQFVTAYRASIDVENAPGGGAIFTLGLPLSETD
jgi:signal transduction histidine kinase